MGLMGDTPEQEGTEGDVDHGLGYVEALLVVPNEAAPAHHPAEGSLDDPSPRQHLETLLVVGSPDDFDYKLKKGRLVHQRQPVVGAIGEEMLDPGPACADGVAVPVLRYCRRCRLSRG